MTISIENLEVNLKVELRESCCKTVLQVLAALELLKRREEECRAAHELVTFS